MAAATLLSDFRSLTEQAIQASDQFCQLYYKYHDTKPHVLYRQFYTEKSLLVWNGNNYNGLHINEFFLNHPGTEHVVTAMDSQPINKIATANVTSIMVICEGKVKYENEREWKFFTQNFLLMSENNTWKIVSDCFRFIDFD